tara:strand:- start:615 stop:1211 length:597 start_codon:yes stop_codon:yes gene_type:complete
MGNTINCSENLCNNNIYEMNWINEKNWLIKYDESKEKPYVLYKGNLKLINNNITNLYLLKNIELEYDIEKVLINIMVNYELKNNNFIELSFVLMDNFNKSNQNTYIINKFKLIKDYLILKNNKYKINEDFRYEILLNFSYLNHILFNENLKKNDNVILNNNEKITYENDFSDLFFGIIINSNLLNNQNVDNYLNIKIL